MQSKVGDAKTEKLCTEGDLKVGDFLKADPEFDAPDTPDVAAFLKKEGLSMIPL